MSAVHNRGMSDLFNGLDDIDWEDFADAYGPADDVPDALRAGSAGDESAWFDLWGMVWHQGTVYSVTPVVVPFLVRIATRPDVPDSARRQAAFLLAAIAAADSFVLPDEPEVMLHPAWCREPGEGTPSRDLVIESNEAVAALATALATSIAGASSSVRAGLIAALGAIGAALPESARNSLAPLVDDADERIRAAVGLTLSLASGTLTAESIADAARIDAEVTAYLEAVHMWPDHVRAVAIIREFCESVAGDDWV